jgi:hypothetical protein
VYQIAELLKIVNKYIEQKSKVTGYKTELQTALETAQQDSLLKLSVVVNSYQTDLAAMKGQLGGATGVARKSLDTRIALVEEQLARAKVLAASLEKEKKLLTADKILSALPVIIEYTNLLASLGQAENSEQVKQLLNSTALPSGSSRIKKKTNFNFAVNGYVGWFWGRDASSGDGFTNSFGITAPVGLSLSTGFGEAGSVSLFTGVLDVGSVVRYKLNEAGKYQQDVSVGNILSPSAQVVYGFPWYLPFAIGAGVQWSTPAEIALDKIALKPHFNVFVAVDIPLFNLASRKKFSYAGYGN